MSFLKASLVALAITLSAHALAQGSRTLTCTSNLTDFVACFVEQIVFTSGPLEVGIGVDANASRASTISPYLIIGWYAERWSTFAEITLPQDINPIGRSNLFRLGFSLRF